jgi:hypothetical protein
MRNVGIVIYRIPWVKDVGMIPQNYFHLPFQNKDEFLPVMDRSLGGFNRSGFQRHNERFHVTVFLLKP